MSDIVDQKELQLYKKTFLKKPLFVPHEAFISHFPTSHLLDWQERLLVERMESRFDCICILLKDQKNDWEAVLFILLAKGFGLNQNGATFLLWQNKFAFLKVKYQLPDSRSARVQFA